MTVTVGDLIARTERRLFGSTRQILNVLDADLTASATTFTCRYPTTGIGLGSYLAVNDELLYVVEADQSARQVTVIRSMMDSSGAAHTAGALIYVNPVFPRHAIRQALKEEIQSWPEDLFRVGDFEITTQSGVVGYDLELLPSEFYNVLDVQIQGGPNALNWGRPGYRVMRTSSLDTFPSGIALLFNHEPPSGKSVQVVFAQPFDLTTFTDGTDVETTVGLQPFMTDIPPIGAAWRLMATREVRRTFGEGQGEPRRGEEIPPGFSAATASGIKRIRDGLLSEAMAKLRARYPYREM